MRTRAVLSFIMLCLLSFTLSAYAQDTASRTEYPLTIENCGRTLTYEAPPQRVLATWQNTGEILLALGLEDDSSGCTTVSRMLNCQNLPDATVHSVFFRSCSARHES